MGDYNKDSAQDKFIDNLIRKFAGCSEKELLDEFETARTMDLPWANIELLSDEFEVIWARIQEDRAEERKSAKRFHGRTIPTKLRHAKSKGGKFSWKRLAAVGVAACLMAGSGGMVAMGTKSYFYRESSGEGENSGIVFNNDTNRIFVNGEDEAYELIQKALDIKPLKLGYMPTDMHYLDTIQGDGYISVEFIYKNELVYFMQSKYDKGVSSNAKFDYKLEQKSKVHNKWLGKEIEIEKGLQPNGKAIFQTSIVIDGACYGVIGFIDGTEFYKIVEGLMF